MTDHQQYSSEQALHQGSDEMDDVREVCVICAAKLGTPKTSPQSQDTPLERNLSPESLFLHPAPILCAEHEKKASASLEAVTRDLGGDYGSVLSALFLSAVKSNKFSYDDAVKSMRAIQLSFGPIRVQLTKPRSNATQDLKRFCRKHYKTYPGKCTSKPPPNQAAKEDFVRWARVNDVDLSAFANSNRTKLSNSDEDDEDDAANALAAGMKAAHSRQPMSVQPQPINPHLQNVHNMLNPYAPMMMPQVAPASSNPGKSPNGGASNGHQPMNMAAMNMNMMGMNPLSMSMPFPMAAMPGYVLQHMNAMNRMPQMSPMMQSGNLNSNAMSMPMPHGQQQQQQQPGSPSHQQRLPNYSPTMPPMSSFGLPPLTGSFSHSSSFPPLTLSEASPTPTATPEERPIAASSQ